MNAMIPAALPIKRTATKAAPDRDPFRGSRENRGSRPAEHEQDQEEHLPDQAEIRSGEAVVPVEIAHEPPEGEQREQPESFSISATPTE